MHSHCMGSRSEAASKEERRNSFKNSLEYDLQYKTRVETKAEKEKPRIKQQQKKLFVLGRDSGDQSLRGGVVRHG